MPGSREKLMLGLIVCSRWVEHTSGLPAYNAFEQRRYLVICPALVVFEDICSRRRRRSLGGRLSLALRGVDVHGIVIFGCAWG